MIYRAILIAALIGCCFGCSCMRPNVTQIYCNSQFVGLLRINAEPEYNQTAMSHTFCVTKLSALKGYDLQVKKIVTPSSSAACGRYYEVGGEYLVLGNPSDGVIHTYLCGHEENWTKLDEEKRSERETYFRSIQCPTPSTKTI